MTTDRMSKMTLEEIYAYSTVDAMLPAYRAYADQLTHPATQGAPQGTTTQGTNMATTTTTTPPATITNPVRPLWQAAVNTLPAPIQPYAPLIYGGGAAVLVLLLLKSGKRRRR